MKILSDEEKNAHWNHVLYEGAKGLAIGLGVSYGIVQFIKKRHPITYKTMSASTKAATWAVPTIGISAFWADEGSIQFDEETYRSDFLKKQKEEMEAKLQAMSTSDRIFHELNENKYKIIVGSWAASLYGSWKYVNRDPYMNTQQKLVQARVYAQAITIVLLLGTILLSMKEAELKKNEPKPVPEWKRYLEEQEASKNQ